VSATNGNNPARRRSRHPYRDSAIAYAVLGGLVIVIAFATGSGLLKSVAGGLAAFVLATAWTWWRLRARMRDQEPERPRP
jgi:Flp pilus assembly protein TadB